MQKLIITAALTGGVHGKEANPALPEQPDEIIQAAYDCYNAGAAIVHIHARDRDGNQTASKIFLLQSTTVLKANVLLSFKIQPAVRGFL
jgi:3-keto-5-aminohexanoate cleavage enzyme